MRDYISVKELVAESGLSERTIRKFIGSGDLPCYRPNPKGKIIVRRSDFEAWLETTRVEARNHPIVVEILREFAEAKAK